MGSVPKKFGRGANPPHGSVPLSFRLLLFNNFLKGVVERNTSVNAIDENLLTVKVVQVQVLLPVIKVAGMAEKKSCSIYHPFIIFLNDAVE